jgi:putative sterol carrier protein
MSDERVDQTVQHVFSDADHFYEVMRDVFEMVKREPEKLESITSSNLVLRINTLEPTAEILIDGRQPPLEVFFGERPGAANIEIEIAADLLHKMWLGKVSTRESFFSGKIKTRGNMLKMMRLTELFYECEKAYPAIVAKYGLPS